MVQSYFEWPVCRRRVPAALALALAGLLVLAAGADQPRRPVRVTVQDEQPQVELVEHLMPVDRTPRIRYQFGPNMRFGFMVETPQGFQNITCGTGGETNNTRCLIDGQDLEFGVGGRFDPQQAPLSANPAGRKREGTKSTWIHSNVHITQVLEIVPTKPAKPNEAQGKRSCDACMIRYMIENKDTRAHTVGVRNMIDVLVAGNDGAQFAVPDKQGFRMVQGGDFRTAKDVPPVVKALQQPDLNNPGVVAYITTRVGGRLEAPGRLVLTRWPGSGIAWEVPAQQALGDTAYAVYWMPQPLQPGAKREVGFAYGKGVVANLEDEGRVAVALGGSFEPGKMFTVTAYVDSPLDGQSLALELPPGMAHVEGRAMQPVPSANPNGLSMVLWKATTQKTGRFPLRVRSSTGVTQTKNITITP